MSSQADQTILHSCPNCAALLDVSEQEPFSEIHCPSCGTKMRVRKQFDNFELTEAIASGGMGTVYKARDVNLNRIVALKLLRREFSADVEYTEKLETEAKITASVNHPFVVKVFSFGCDHGLYYIAMELVDKGSLDDLMNLQGRIAEVQVLEIGIQVAQGLRAAFHAGLIHRDVKPGNILFADAHTAKIVDFGLAMPLEQATDVEEEIWGTPYYVAPEKLNHEPEDFRSDIYSLGGTLFHALAGRPPFEAENASLVALKHLKNQAVSLQAFAPDISSPTSYVINRTLAKDPEDRYASYDELIEHLEYARTQLLESSGKPRQPKARVVVESEDQQQMLGYITMGVIAFVVVLGVVIFLFRDNITSRRDSLVDIEKKQVERSTGEAEQVYLDLRKQILTGDSLGALADLKQLEERPNLGQPIKNWIIIQEGIAAFLNNLTWDGLGAFHRLQKEGFYSNKPEDSRLANFFAEVARLASGDNPLHETIAADYRTNDYEPIGLFIFGLKEWQAGRFTESAALFESFLSTSPKGDWAWIEGYKPLAKRYVSDASICRTVLAQIKAADTPEAKAATLSAIAAAKEKLQLTGKLPEVLDNAQRSFHNNQPSSDRVVSKETVGTAGTAPVSMTALRANVWPLIVDFRWQDAQRIIDNSLVDSADNRAKITLSRQMGGLFNFKGMLITAINLKKGKQGRIDRSSAPSTTGVISKASDSGVMITTGQGVVYIPWQDITPESIIWIGDSEIGGGKSVPGVAEADWLWDSGLFMLIHGRQKEALPRLTQAAQLRSDYRGLLGDLKATNPSGPIK